jgi:hypothetical protein
MLTSKSIGFLKYQKKSTLQKTCATHALLELNVLSGRLRINKYMECGAEKMKANFVALFQFLTLAKKLGANGSLIALTAAAALTNLE